MILNRERRWAVVTPPRSGSRTLNMLLTRPQFGGELHERGERGHHDTEPPAYDDGFERYILVRNPFARAVSLWRHWSDGPSFAAFSRLLESGSLGWFYGPLSSYGVGMPIRLELLTEDLQPLRPAGPYVVPHENPSPPLEPWRLAYEREPGAVSPVTGWAAADLESFGYGLD